MDETSSGPKIVRHSLRLGLGLGLLFGVWNILATLSDPLSDDSITALLTFYGPMFLAWGVAAFVVARRSGQFIDGVKTGATVALITFSVFWIMNLLRVNLFLDVMRHRADWQSMLIKFQASGFEDFRTFVNYEYLVGAPLKLFVPTVIGAVTGSIGGLLGIALSHRSSPQLPQH